MSIQVEIQKAGTDPLIDLFIIDLNPIGVNLVHRFVDGRKEAGDVLYGGQVFTPAPITASGFEITSTGTMPRPKLQVGNVLGTMTALAEDYDDLAGAKLTRIRTFRRYLDDGATPSQADRAPLEVYFVERKVSESRTAVEWELVSVIDLEGRKLPARVITQDTCMWAYRQDGCGYVGTAMFTLAGQSTTDPAKDVCGLTLKDCRLRHPTGSMPFGAFPGARVYRDQQ